MKKITFKHSVGNETLSGIILQNDQNQALPSCIYLHGGKLSTKGYVFDFAQPILEKNINILSFDFSGHGESTGILSHGSLKKRITEAQEIIKSYASQKDLILIGASMGGYVAIKLLETFSVDTLILFCPALYTAKAYSVPFNEGFTEIIREHESWRNTDALEILEKFTGKLLVIIGSEDQIIPKGVIDLIMNNTPKTLKKELLIIPNCSHQIHNLINSNPEDLKKVQEKISQYL